jgi:hypothetical protein
VLNNMAKRGEDLVTGVSQQLKQAGNDYGDIAYSATHLSEPGAKQKLTAAIDRRQKAPAEMAVGMAKGFAHQLKNVGEGLGNVAYYRPEFAGLGGILPSHAKEQGADAKVASAITDIVLDGPQIVLTVEGGINVAKGAAGAMGRAPTGGGGGVPPRAPTGGGGAAGGGGYPFTGLTEAEIDSALSNIEAGQHYRTPVDISEQVGRTSLDDLVPVSRWGKPGLRPGDWVMPGDPTKWNYLRSFKWENHRYNMKAAPESGQAFMVPKGSVQWPTGWESFKGVFNQRRYSP